MFRFEQTGVSKGINSLLFGSGLLIIVMTIWSVLFFELRIPGIYWLHEAFSRYWIPALVLVAVLVIFVVLIANQEWLPLLLYTSLLIFCVGWYWLIGIPPILPIFGPCQSYSIGWQTCDSLHTDGQTYYLALADPLSFEYDAEKSMFTEGEASREVQIFICGSRGWFCTSMYKIHIEERIWGLELYQKDDGLVFEYQIRGSNSKTLDVPLD